MTGAMPVHATLCYIVRDGRVLLLRKAPHLWGGDKWNAPGGKLQPGEDPVAGAVREVEEETGLHVSDLAPAGLLRFYFGQEEAPDWIVHVFRTGTVAGEARAGREGHLAWHPVEALPYDEMWEDDRHWLPLLLAGHPFEGDFYFDREAQRLLRYTLNGRPAAPAGGTA